MNLVGQMKAREQIRERQQGLGRPIVSFKLGDQQMVAVNKTVYPNIRDEILEDAILLGRMGFSPILGSATVAGFSGNRLRGLLLPSVL